MDFIKLNTPINGIFCKKAFELLTTKEKFYSYYFSNACW